MIRILLADDHAVVRRQVRHILEQSGDCEICGEAAGGRCAVELAVLTKPDVVVLDIDMPDLNGFEAARQIQKALPGTEFVILTVHYAEELVRTALEVGARSFVRKSDAGLYLVAAVRCLSRHKPYFTAELPQAALDDFLKSSPDRSAPSPGRSNGYGL